MSHTEELKKAESESAETARIIEELVAPAKGIPVWGRAWLTFDRYNSTGLIVFYAAMMGVAAFYYLSLGPTWAGFLAAGLPASFVAAIAHASYAG